MTEKELFLLSGLESVLGKADKKSGKNHAFHCPFCNHRKKKLEVNIETSDKGYNLYSCWVCGEKGRSVESLLYKVGVEKQQVDSITQYIKKTRFSESKKDTPNVLRLPKEFRSAFSKDAKGYSHSQARHYLHSRGISDVDIVKYNIGYCSTGLYKDRIIIPSYDSNNRLNYFISRSYSKGFRKYMNPNVSKDIIFFENLINWHDPIVLVEGVFDAISVRHNAIPMLGKRPSKKLKETIAKKHVSTIIIMLDSDAKSDAMDLGSYFQKQGINTFVVLLNSKDPNELGYEKVFSYIENSKPLTYKDILINKVQNI